MFYKIGSCLVLLLVAASVVTAKEWRGIVPLKSTRNDVERLFGAPKQSSSSSLYYNLSREIVVFHLQTNACHDEGGVFGLGWNVPFGTVVAIGVIPKGSHRKEEYLSASDATVQDEGAGFIYYSHDAAGLSVETYKDLVTLVDYSPEASQDNLSCPRIRECCIDFFSKFDEYYVLSFEDEKARLDNFLFQVKQLFARGVIEVRGPSKRDRQKHMKRAARARDYLIKQRRFEGERLLIVDGGFHERAMTLLSVNSIGGLVSRIHLYPEKDPETAVRKK